MLIGLAAKNGILIVEFANQLRDRGVEFRDRGVEFYEAIIESLGRRSAAALGFGRWRGKPKHDLIGGCLGRDVLVVADAIRGAGVYTFVARNTKSPEYITQMIERLRTAAGKALPPARDSEA